MPLENVKEAREWMSKAATDLRVADLVLHADPPFIEDAMFHCQQAVEKSLKGFLAYHDQPFHKTHDIDRLGKMCDEYDSGISEILGPVRDYTMMAWLFRYPGEASVPSREEAETALTNSRSVYENIFERIR